MASKLVSYVHTVQLKLKIEQATLPHIDEPTPLYIYDEVTEAIGRDRKNIDDAIDCLEQRLQFRSTSTKQKALKLIKHMSQKGSGELQRALVRLSGQIKELQAFRCAPDAFKGDVPWKRVQEYAKEALEAIHSVKGDGARNGGDWGSGSLSSGLSTSTTGGKRMEGFGNDATGRGMSGASGATSGGATSSSRRYEGFGSGGAHSSNVLEHDQSEAWGLPFGTKLAMGLNELKSAAIAGAVGLGDFAGAYSGKGASGSPNESGYRSTYSPPTRPQIDVDAFEEHGYASHSTRNAMIPMSNVSNASNMSTSAEKSGGGTVRTPSSQSLEERLVQQFLSKSQGVRVAPTADECTKFLTTCAGHGSIPLAKAFEKTLLHGSWKEVLRALCVLDVAATGGGISGTPVISSMVEYFKEHPESLHRASDSAQDRVRSKAMSVLVRMGIDPQPTSQHASGVAAELHGRATGLVPAQDTSTGIDLLSMDALDAPDGLNELDSLETVSGTNTVGGNRGNGVSAPQNTSHPSDALGDTNLPSLLDALEVNDTDFAGDTTQNIRDDLTPNSPVAGLISGSGASIQSKPSDPFGDWLGAEETSPVPQSPATVSNAPSYPKTVNDPFGTLDMGVVANTSTAPSNGSMPTGTPPPILDDFFTSMPSTTMAPSLSTTTASAPAPMTGNVAPPTSVGNSTPTDVLGAWHATTSGFSSSQREEAAFDFGPLV